MPARAITPAEHAMSTCDDCGGEGGYEVAVAARAPPWGDGADDGYWVDCPTCNGSGWVDEIQPDLGMVDLDERSGIETGACCACRGVEPDDEPPALRVIGRLDPPTFDVADFPGFTIAQIALGLTVPAVLLTEAEIEAAARICPVLRGPHITGSAG